MLAVRRHLSLFLAVALLILSAVSAFSPFRVLGRGIQQTGKTLSSDGEFGKIQQDPGPLLRTTAIAIVASVVLGSNPAFADELGRETEAPTLFTGETVMICTKRGPLGACLKTEARTQENDNDKANKYFQEPSALVKQKDDEARMVESDEGNALIQKLKQQSEDNREKNDLLVQQRTFMNDASANFGPFDGQVLIMNEDGKGFTLLANPQAMRLKKDGFIKEKRFIKQPTQEEIDNALEADRSSFFEGIFSSKE